MKKNVLTLVSILVIGSVALAACAGTTPVAITKTPATAYKYTDMIIGFIQVGSEGAWRSANSASFKETAVALGVRLKFYDSASPGNYQIAAFQQFINDPEVNVIVISPLEASGWEELLQEAKDTGKPVILSDRRIEVGNEDLYATFVGSDFVEEGRKAGAAMCKLLAGSQKKNVWELVGNVGSSAAKDRGQGFRETAEKCGIVVTNSQTANWNIIEGQQIIEVWLKESKDVQGIFAQNDEMGLGAIEALKKIGLVPAVDVKIISIDATSAAFQAMLNRDLNVTVECNPLLAPQVYEAALAALNGETLPKWIPTKENVFFMDDKNLEEIAAGRKY
ncbi:MAG: ABC transporter substrate-binding protein [Chloroflexi bacterium]|nr:ABC transporter substrate-binding protein [Chloroflexota bacterium]